MAFPQNPLSAYLPATYTAGATYESNVRGLEKLSLEGSSSDISNAKPHTVEVSKIRFTQNSVSPYFSDGTSVEELAQKLASGELSVGIIKLIRVVRYQNQLWSIDNRRLRAFKDGLVDKVQVLMVDLKDPNVAKEFWAKKTGKSAIESGILRREQSVGAQHFESAIYAFNKIVLNWTFEQIEQPMPGYKKQALSDSYENRITYYDSFEPLILEEVRAILHMGIQEAEQRSPFRFSLIRFKVAKKADNPTEIKFGILPGSEKEVKSGDALLLESKGYPKVRLTALANYSPLNSTTPELSFKVVVDADLLQEFPQAFEKDQEWTGKALGSLITLQRIYEACKKGQERSPTSLENSIIKNAPHVWNEPSSHPLNSKLNPSQVEALSKFLQLKEGLFLIQGPPGTGKTTTVVELLRLLQERGEKILVCAPANKAVQILAKRFMDLYPEIPIILVGAEEPPSDSSLNRIFMDSWCYQKMLFLTKVSDTLGSFQPRKIAEGNPKLLPDRVKNAYQGLQELCREFSAFVKEVEKYRLSCLQGLELQNSRFQEAINSYSSIIASQECPWKEVAFYYAQEEAPTVQMPKFISQARSYLSTASVTLSSLQYKLKMAQENETSGGLEAELINHSQLIFSTLSVSGQQRMKNALSVDTLIIDEAGQAVEAETLIPMGANPKKCLLIGDIRQLPATVISQDAEKLRFGRSMMERLIEGCKQSYEMLKIQYRMHPEISRWPSLKYYNGELANHDSVSSPQHTLKEMHPFLAPYSFINIEGKEKRGPLGRSFFNPAEVKSAALIVNYLAKQRLINVEKNVAIISFYAEQVNQINGAMRNRYPNIRVNTVDGFQGEESNIVIISCVRANLEQQIGFLKHSKRLNVALTRAKFSLIILGNKATLMRSDISELVVDANERKVLFEESVLQSLVAKATTPQKQKGKPFNAKQSATQVKTNQKTELCRYYALFSCYKGSQCSFAHGTTELNQKGTSSFNHKK
ncbi:MAG: AAA family ATPase [Chlamydiia bacterium]|nr:AAA family ATPase [Chlamydiia bacterium]